MPTYPSSGKTAIGIIKLYYFRWGDFYLTCKSIIYHFMELPKPPLAFDEKLWSVSIDHATVYNDGRIVFKFVNGAEI